MLSYWTAFFIVITLEEHFIFRRPGRLLGGYDFEVYDSPRRLPLGIAGIIAGCCGVAGAVVGMAQVYYTGPIARKIGMFGADLGFEVCSRFLTYIIPEPKLNDTLSISAGSCLCRNFVPDLALFGDQAHRAIGV